MRPMKSNWLIIKIKEKCSACGFAHVAQSAEHILGKDEVTGSIPVMGSMDCGEYVIDDTRCDDEKGSG